MIPEVGLIAAIINRLQRFFLKHIAIDDVADGHVVRAVLTIPVPLPGFTLLLAPGSAQNDRHSGTSGVHAGDALRLMWYSVSE